MRINSIARALIGLFFVQVWGLAIFHSPILTAQQPPHCAQILFCLFNQEAAASDSAGIQKYSQDLIERLVSNSEGRVAIRKPSGHLVDRLAVAEQSARAGGGKLVPEAAVVKAFNDLMQEIGAPSSLRTREASVHEFREHAVSINAFSALFSANRNGTNCNPGEAVFLLSLLLSGNGVLFDRNLDVDLSLMQSNSQSARDRHGASVTSLESLDSNAEGMLFGYLLQHDLNTNIALFDQVARTLGL